MPVRYAHILQLRLTRHEWKLIAEFAQLRGITPEDLLREALRLSPPGSEPMSARKRHLRAVESG